MTQEIFDAIADFLQFCGMNSTLSVFQSERISVPPLEDIAKHRAESQSDFKRDLINSLNTGDCQRFRYLWESRWSAPPDQNAQHLLFLTEVFFAVFPLHPANRVKFGDLNESLRRFKEFLDTHYTDLSQSTEFLPFYALPYIPNPIDHPSFKQIFSIDWFNSLKKRLSDWLDRQIGSTQLPLLATALRVPTDQIVSTDSELWSAALELADALQHSLNGEIPSRERVDSMFRRIGIFPGGAVKFTATTDFSPLDLNKVKNDLLNPELASPLLKACVNRLVRSPAEHVQRFYIELISGDIFEISKNKIINGLLLNEGPARAYLLRVLNILATDQPGRKYLLQNPKFIESLLPLLEGEDGCDMMNTIGILQKLSMVKDAKIKMINLGVLDLALKLISDPSRLSDYSAEYSAALVMNLSLRPEAIKKFIDNDTLSQLAELAGLPNPHLQQYANFILSQLFTKEPLLREKAKALGLPVLFEQMKKTSDPSNIEMYDYVIKAMAGQTEEINDNELDEEEAGNAMFDSYEEVGDENWTFEIEGEALLAKYVLATNEAVKSAANIDKNLRQSISRMSISPNGLHSGRRPITPKE